jgi:hypothetical protein
VFGGEGASRVTDQPSPGRDAGVRLAERAFGADRTTDGRWVTIADVAAADGESVAGRRVFRLEVEGVTGTAGNVYDVAVSLKTNTNETPADLRLSAIHPTIRIPSRGQGLALRFTLPPDTSSINIGNFDLASGFIELVGPFRTIPLTSSKQGNWQYDRVPLLDYERGQLAEIVVSGGEEIPNDLTLAIADDAGRPLPLELRSARRSRTSGRLCTRA